MWLIVNIVVLIWSFVVLKSSSCLFGVKKLWDYY